MAPFRNPITILLADDDDDDCVLIRSALEESGFPSDLRTVYDGEELMDYLHRRNEYRVASLSPRPDLILLDLNMPKKDGREALREIRSDPRFRGIPIVVLTTSGEEADILRSYDLGANSYITKPVTFNDLVDTIKMIGRYWFETVELPTTRDSDRSGEPSNRGEESGD